MSEIGVILPDGSPLKLPEGASGADAAAAIGPGLARRRARRSGWTASSAISRRRLADGEAIEIVTAKSEGGRRRCVLIRHDAAHVMATAVCDLWPGTKVSIGPPIEDGFYYDFEFPDGVQPSPRPTWSGSRRRCASTSPPTSRFERTRHPGRRGARALPRRGPALQGRADRGPGRATRASRPCRCTATARSPTSAAGPHAPSTGRIEAFKLNSLAGAYWRGDEKRQMLTRIYGTAFFSQAGPRPPPRAARAGAGARPSPPRPGARPLPVPRGGAGDAVLASERDRAAGG